MVSPNSPGVESCTVNVNDVDSVMLPECGVIVIPGSFSANTGTTEPGNITALELSTIDRIRRTSIFIGYSDFIVFFRVTPNAMIATSINGIAQNRYESRRTAASLVTQS